MNTTLEVGGRPGPIVRLLARLARPVVREAMRPVEVKRRTHAPVRFGAEAAAQAHQHARRRWIEFSRDAAKLEESVPVVAERGERVLSAGQSLVVRADASELVNDLVAVHRALPGASE